MSQASVFKEHKVDMTTIWIITLIADSHAFTPAETKIKPVCLSHFYHFAVAQVRDNFSKLDVIHCHWKTYDDSAAPFFSARISQACFKRSQGDGVNK